MHPPLFMLTTSPVFKWCPVQFLLLLGGQSPLATILYVSTLLALAHLVMRTTFRVPSTYNGARPAISFATVSPRTCPVTLYSINALSSCLILVHDHSCLSRPSPVSVIESSLRLHLIVDNTRSRHLVFRRVSTSVFIYLRTTSVPVSFYDQLHFLTSRFHMPGWGGALDQYTRSLMPWYLSPFTSLYIHLQCDCSNISHRRAIISRQCCD